MTDLLPCPFCGGGAQEWPDEVGSGGQHVLPYYVGCRSCGVFFKDELCEFTDEARANCVTAWNKRTQDRAGNEVTDHAASLYAKQRAARAADVVRRGYGLESTIESVAFGAYREGVIAGRASVDQT